MYVIRKLDKPFLSWKEKVIIQNMITNSSHIIISNSLLKRIENFISEFEKIYNGNKIIHRYISFVV